ncbi:hypothetical protein ACFVT2_19650 [Streptomyces sp. NPDC058000]|uniref:hypothetical protein n=1 Tax=Streptomyces sp. NPDC058000 TaxID=3346299 RepID=UPI0036E0F711
MLATGVAGGIGTFSNISGIYGNGTAVGAVAAGEGATAVLALVLLGQTLLGQPSPLIFRVGLWALPIAASAMSAMAAPDSSRTVIYALTPMGMCVSAEGMAFLARRIVVHQDGRDVEADRKAAAVVQALAYHRARAANHPDADLRAKSERESWKLARKVGTGDTTLASRLLEVQRERVTVGADAAIADMFTVTAPATPVTETVVPVTPSLTTASAPPALESASTGDRDAEGTQVNAQDTPSEPLAVTGTEQTVTPVTPPVTEDRSDVTAATLEELAAVAGVPTPVPGERLTDEQLVVVLRHLRYRDDPPLSYRQAGADFRDAGYVGSEQRVRKAWGALMSHEEADTARDVEVGETEKDQ